MLEDLADETWQNVIDQVRAKLGQHGTIDAAKLATELRVSSSEIAHSLAALATRGLVGYDLHHHTYFHRVLPFQSDLVESLQPRLVAARQLIAKNGVTRHSSDNPAESQWIVQGSEVNHRVILSQDRASCTCLWYSKHQNSRGPCKHILAANLIAEGDDECQK